MVKAIEPVNKANIFARPGKSANMSMGIVGLPNTGKSTLFNRLTNSSVLAANYPFCTIDPHTGNIAIKDERLDFLESNYKPKKKVCSYLSITDIAGLVKGAHAGEGIGNQFLDNIRNVDGIFLVVRCFKDPLIGHVENSIDPLRDIDIIKDELRMKDIETLTKKLEVIKKDLRNKGKDKKLEKYVLTTEKCLEILKEKWINEGFYDNEEIEFISTLNLLTTKGVVILANISKKHYESGKGNRLLLDVMKKYEGGVIPFSAVSGCESFDENGNLIVNIPFDNKLIRKIVTKGYETLGLINFFTAGPDETRSWTIRQGTTAAGAGGTIHSDFKNYFISADVISYNDYTTTPNENALRSAGLIKKQGKNYIVNDGDIMLFKSNPPKGGARK